MYQIPRVYLVAAVLASIFFCLAPAQAEIKLDDAGKIILYGDARFRVEADWDSSNSVGAQRDDRTRLRTRLRAGLNIVPTDKIKLGFRLRSGSDFSHQSAHVTLIDLDDNDTGDADFNFDKWYVSYSDGNATVWAGRNSLPFWKQNELLWDDDVTPAGVGATWKFDNVAINAGYFSLPVGMQSFSGNMAVGQVVYKGKVGENNSFTLAGGLLSIDGNPTDSDASQLLDGNGARDYRTWVVSGQYKFSVRERPMTFGLDYLNNSESYSPTDPDPFTAFNQDETDGFVASVNYGSTNPGQWLAAYYYANVETFAMNSSYAQDDWMRWGSAVETRGTNFSGHEFRVAYGIMDNMNLVARLYIVEANVLRSASATAKEDGSRLRIDINYKF